MNSVIELAAALLFLSQGTCHPRQSGAVEPSGWILLAGGDSPAPGTGWQAAWDE